MARELGGLSWLNWRDRQGSVERQEEGLFYVGVREIRGLVRRSASR